MKSSDLLFCYNADVVAVVSLVIENLSVYLCKESIVFSETDVLARMDLCAVLADKDLTALDELAAVALYAQALCIGISSVL